MSHCNKMAMSQGTDIPLAVYCCSSECTSRRNLCGWYLHCLFTSVFSSVGSTPDPRHSSCGHHSSSLHVSLLECSCFILASFVCTLTCSAFSLPLTAPVHADSCASVPFTPNNSTFSVVGLFAFFFSLSRTWQITCVRRELLYFHYYMV